MNIEVLMDEIRKTGMHESFVNIGDRACCDECFNLISRPDGKWEIFYGEHGQKTNLRVYDSEEEAADAFLKLMKEKSKGRPEDRLPFLPVGSVVRLAGGNVNLVIVARALHVKDKNGRKVYYDYGAFPYPHGLVDGNMAYFQKDAIEDVLFVGFINEQEEQIVQHLLKFNEANKGIPKGNKDSL